MKNSTFNAAENAAARAAALLYIEENADRRAEITAAAAERAAERAAVTFKRYAPAPEMNAAAAERLIAIARLHDTARAARAARAAATKNRIAITAADRDFRAARINSYANAYINHQNAARAERAENAAAKKYHIARAAAAERENAARIWSERERAAGIAARAAAERLSSMDLVMWAAYAAPVGAEREISVDIWAILNRLAVMTAASACKYHCMYTKAKTGDYIDTIRRRAAENAHTHDYAADDNAITAAENAARAAALAGDMITARREKRRAADLRGRAVYQSIDIDDIISACLIAGAEWLKKDDAPLKSLYHSMYLAGRRAIRRAAADMGRAAERAAVEERAAAENAENAENAAADRADYQQYAADRAAAENADRAAAAIADIRAALPTDYGKLHIDTRAVFDEIVKTGGNCRRAAFNLDISDDIVEKVLKMAIRIAQNGGVIK